MILEKGNKEFEDMIAALNNPDTLKRYKEVYDDYKPGILPLLLGKFLVFSGNLVYGHKPTYLKFRAVEIIARVPYYSWSSAAYTLMTMFFSDEKKALELSRISKFGQFSQENETMHVVVISQLASEHQKAGFIRHTLIPIWFSFFYFWWSYLLFLVKPRWSYELNYLFESHAFDQYQKFLDQNEHELKTRKIESEFLNWYGRYPRSQYEFFMSVRNDEIVHRNSSIEEIKLMGQYNQ